MTKVHFADLRYKLIVLPLQAQGKQVLDDALLWGLSRIKLPELPKIKFTSFKTNYKINLIFPIRKRRILTQQDVYKINKRMFKNGQR